MAGGGSSSSNASRLRKRVEADTSSSTALKRARDGSAFAKCEECNKDVPVALISFHNCSLDAKIKMNLEAQVVEMPSEVKKKPPSERKKSSKKTESSVQKGKTANNSKKLKRPPTAFFVFMDDFRKSFKESNPDTKGAAKVAKEGGEKWKSILEREPESPFELRSRTEICAGNLIVDTSARSKLWERLALFKYGILCRKLEISVPPVKRLLERSTVVRTSGLAKTGKGPSSPQLANLTSIKIPQIVELGQRSRDAAGQLVTAQSQHGESGEGGDSVRDIARQLVVVDRELGQVGQAEDRFRYGAGEAISSEHKIGVWRVNWVTLPERGWQTTPTQPPLQGSDALVHVLRLAVVSVEMAFLKATRASLSDFQQFDLAEEIVSVVAMQMRRRRRRIILNRDFGAAI
ncbi:High mobility group B protein 7 [Striga hermonthica]|uniref:High mobility group B protein 7 n=1 Tax=Striga hermonthica TaxID=68872 RepID=A0A9N7MS78_STRHE|nr:High mobility group B protein 7 [Striga hermonthica]